MATDCSDAEWKELRAGPFIDGIGPLLRTTAQDGERKYGLQTGDRHCNAIGTVHGGLISSLLDHALAIEAWNAANRRATVTLQMDTRFISAVKSGDFLCATINLRQAKKTLLFLDADAMVGSQLAATASAVMKIV